MNRYMELCWNGLNFNVGGLTLQASIKCYLVWIVKENGKEQHQLELYSCIAKMYDSIGNNGCMPMLESMAWSTKSKICNSACNLAWRNTTLMH